MKRRELTGGDVARVMITFAMIMTLNALGMSIWAAWLVSVGVMFLVACYAGWRQYQHEQDAKPFGPEIERIP